MPSLSQKYRPQTFADVTGQRHVTDTLAKEVASGRLGHAFLFCGPRGVGKTTTARVFAKALNCEHPKNGEPDNSCANCVAANEGRQIDFIELDAATHTGVETIRESIVEHVRFAPMSGGRKVYVLDEAHMLSTASWNALLKTLEEPPAYAFFILATTEWHKVPATIVSRCQRFEFKRVQDDVMLDRVNEIAKKEEWKVDEEVAKLIVSRADGCVRDAETLLGQLGALGDKHLTLERAHLVVPESHLPAAAGLMLLWSSRDHASSLAEARRLADDGLPLIPFFDDLISIVRSLLAASGDSKLATKWEKGSEDERALVPLINKFTPGELNDIALLLFERRKDSKGGVDPLFALELAGTIAAGGLLRNASSAPVIPAKAGIQLSEQKAQPVSVPKVELKINEPLPVAPVIAVVPIEPIVEAPAPAPVSSGSDLDLNFIRMKWQAIIRDVDEKNHALPFILKIAKPERVQGMTVFIRFQYGFHMDKIIGSPVNRQMVEESMRKVLEMPTLSLDGFVGEDTSAPEVQSQDIVGNILKAFGGSVVEQES